MKKDEAALESLERALALKRDSAESWICRGNALRGLKRHDEALKSFDQALAINPSHAAALCDRASLLLDDLRQPGQALADFDKALAIKPDFAICWNNRGNALRELRRLPEALASYERALSFQPDLAGALKSRGHILFELNRLEEGVAAFQEAAARLDGREESPPSPHKLRHDQEQRDYRQSVKSAGAPGLGERTGGPAVNRHNRVTETEEQWRSKKPQIAVIDDLLSPEALEALRRFCLEAPVWRSSHPNGYLGAFPEAGFTAPLLAQIADELRDVFPAIFRDHPLHYMWGFKYDGSLRGINLHADEAAVNVNFWLTPDEANLDPKSGGLVIWDVTAPLDWNFAKFNGDTKAMRDFLAKAGAKPVTVPYRANRAVIFDSDLFHETDTIRFREGYLNRRINVTMLYGRRRDIKPL
jgi:regulator of sirC expression with transglutaminase-like and TPR domain